MCHYNHHRVNIVVADYRLFHPLRATFFHRKHRNVSTIYAIPPHWPETGGWNLSSCKTRTYLFYMMNCMGADVLATQGARASATMIFIMLNRNNSFPARWGLSLNHCGLVTSYGVTELDQHYFRWRLFSKPMLTNHYWGFAAFTWG